MIVLGLGADVAKAVLIATASAIVSKLIDWGIKEAKAYRKRKAEAERSVIER